MKRTTRNTILRYAIATVFVSAFVLIGSLVCMGLDWLIDKSGCPILYPVVLVTGFIFVVYVVGKSITIGGIIMITEDYCSYEVAKLLKEKGFDEPCDNYYDQSSDEPQQLTLDEMYYSYDKFLKAPTHQIAMKWLREVYGLHIWVEYSRFDFNKEHPYLWNIAETKINGDYWGGTYHKSSKEAVESALKYVLENLI